MEATRRQRVTKAIKLFAKPVPATIEAIRRDGLMERNRAVLAAWETLKKPVDAFVTTVLDESLAGFRYDYKEAERLYKEEDKRALGKELENMQRAAANALAHIDCYGLTKVDDLKSAKFVNAALPEFLRTSGTFPGEETAGYMAACESVKGLTAYGTKFLTTRCTALKTTAPTRVVENFQIYMENAKAIKTFLTSPWGKDLFDEESLFPYIADADTYGQFVTTAGIKDYNCMVGGYFAAGGKLSQMGYNQYISELNAKNKKNKDYTGPKFKKIKPLNKQILFPAEKAFVVGKITTNEDARAALSRIVAAVEPEFLMETCSLIDLADPAGVYVHGSQLHTLSHAICNDHALLAAAITKTLTIQAQTKLEAAKAKKAPAKEIKAIEKELEGIASAVSEKDYTLAELKELTGEDIIHAFTEALLIEMRKCESAYTGLIRSSFWMHGDMDCRTAAGKKVIHGYYDAVHNFSRMFSIVADRTKDHLGDAGFYTAYEAKHEVLRNADKGLNQVKSYIVAKPKDLAKEYLCAFGCGSKITNKWYNTGDDKFEQRHITILRFPDESGTEKYYFAELNPVSGKPFVPEFTDNKDDVEMFCQRTSQSAIYVFRRALMSDSGAEAVFANNPEINSYTVTKNVVHPFEITRDLYEISLKTKEERTPEETARYIDLFKIMCENLIRFSCFDFDFKPSNKYANLGEFFTHANTFMLANDFVRVSRGQIDALTASGLLLLFEISSRELYMANPGGYAKVFKTLLSAENMESNEMRLNSRPSLSFRPAIVERKVTHPAGSMVVNKCYTDGTKVPGTIYKQIYENANGRLLEADMTDEAREALHSGRVVVHPTDHDLIKNKRYTEDQFFISLSYVKNTKIPDRAPNPITEEVSDGMTEGYRTLSVVRGVRELLYYHLYETDQTLMEEGSLNVIGGTDYADKLRVISDDRKNAKSEEWIYDRTVKDIRTAYIDLAIAKLCKMALKHHAVVVIEDINDGFKDKMSAIDNQIYAKFSQRLENRLADYYREDVPFGETGSISNPVQLASNDAKRMGRKQNGILFRLSPAYTLRDPGTGFISLFDLSKLSNAKARGEFLRKFKSICFDRSLNLFVAEFDYLDGFILKTGKKHDANDLAKTAWTIYFGKPYTAYDPVKKTNVLHDTPEDVIGHLEAQGLLDKDLSKEPMDAHTTNLLYLLMEHQLKHQVVQSCTDNPESYFDSVANAEVTHYYPQAVKAEHLAKKLWYDVAREDTSEDYMIGWINAHSA